MMLPSAGAQASSGAPITVVRIHGPVQTTQQGDLGDEVLLVAQILGIFSAFGGLVFLGRQVRAANAATAAAIRQAKAANDQNLHAQADAKRRRTTEFQEKFTSPEFGVAHARVLSYLDAEDARDVVEKIQAWVTAAYAEKDCLPRTPRSLSAPKASKIDVASVFGFYENMGAAYRLGQLDEEAFHRTFGPVPAQNFADAWWFICWAREGRFRQATQPTDYSEFEDLARGTLEREPNFKEICKANASIRVIALPDTRVTDGLAWHLCGRLSRALSSHTDFPFDARRAASSSTGPGLIVSSVIAVPNDLGLDACRWLKEVKLAKRLEEQLKQMARPELEAVLRELG